MSLMTPAEIRALAADPAALEAACAAELPTPASGPEMLAAVQYGLGRIARLVAANPALLYVIADELEELHQLVIPAAEALDELAQDGAA